MSLRGRSCRRKLHTSKFSKFMSLQRKINCCNLQRFQIQRMNTCCILSFVFLDKNLYFTIFLQTVNSIRLVSKLTDSKWKHDCCCSWASLSKSSHAWAVWFDMKTALRAHSFSGYVWPAQLLQSCQLLILDLFVYLLCFVLCVHIRACLCPPCLFPRSISALHGKSMK